MSLLVTLDSISLAFGLNTLLDHIKFQISTRERVCLIGRNGAGKSSLLKIISGEMQPDSGNVYRAPNLKIGQLEQRVNHETSKTVYEYVAEGLDHIGTVLNAYHALLVKPELSQSDLKRLDQLQKEIDLHHGWQMDQQIQMILTKLKLNANMLVKELSGGWQRRASLAKALVNQPDLLLLDEPTNHMDIEAIEWLEDQLTNSSIAVLFITHDRALLQRLATRIIELDRGNLTSWPGDYNHFLEKKAELLAAEDTHNKLFDKKLAQEEKWIRQGIKARRTRNEGRVRALKKLREERAERRNIQGKVSFSLNEGSVSGKLVIETKKLHHAFSDTCIVDNLDLQIMRSDRIGLVGPNGVGKSTLINLLLKNLPPVSGEVVHGTKLKIAYYDQLRASLDSDKTVIENITQGTDTLTINGKSKHVISYLEDFLFSPQRAQTPVKALSGGEANRLLLARLFSQESNLIILDEPTNDLDIETLELLEELLMNYKGTLLVISHDRAFLDNVVTSLLFFEGEGKISEFVGGYSDWLMQRQTTLPIIKKEKPIEKSIKPGLSTKEKNELQSIPKKIEKLEQKHAEITHETANPSFYEHSSDYQKMQFSKLAEIEKDLENFYKRWEELENKNN